MRTDNIKITFDMPVQFNKSDGNGVIYTKESIQNAMSTGNDNPIEIIDNNGMGTVVGIVENMTLIDSGDDGVIHIEGHLWHGGTSEEVVIEDNKVTSFSIRSVGITK